MLRTGVMPTISKELTLAAATGLSLALSLVMPSPAKAGDNPNMGHFYMARQQIQITDDSPIVNYKGGDPAQQQQNNPMMQQQKRPAPLPRAGFTGYTPPPTASGFNPNLPSVENGVPKRELPAAGPALNHGDGSSSHKGPKGKQAKAGSLKPGAGGKQATANPGTFTGPTKTYAPYKGYDPNNSPISSSYSSSYGGGGAGGANSQQVKTKVRGALTFGRGK